MKMDAGNAKDYIPTYYKDTLHRNITRGALEQSIETEICVIGGGLAGLSTAIGLAEFGKKVVLLEANRIGWGASGRNGGFIGKSYPANYKTLTNKYGLDFARELHKLSREGRARIKQRIKKYAIDCGPIQDGVLETSWFKDTSSMRDYVAFINKEFATAHEYWEKDKVLEHCKTEKYYGGVFSPNDFQFHPLNYVHGLARGFESLGGEIYEKTKAVQIQQRHAATGWRVKTEKDVTVKADQIVLCCSTYVNGLSNRLNWSSFPIRTFVMVTKPLPKEDLENSINTKHAIEDNRFAHDYYRVLHDGRILWGGRVALTPEPEKLADIMLADLLKVYPQLKGKAETDYAWSGELCYTPHKMPQIGELKPGYWYCTSFGGHGLVPTSVGGDLVASAIAKGDERYQWFKRFRHLNFAGGPLAPYIAQSVYYSWRFADFMKRLAG